jgi:hypothetical protein
VSLLRFGSTLLSRLAIIFASIDIPFFTMRCKRSI